MAHAKNHDYHILPPSIWPLLSALGAFVMLSGAALWMKDITHWAFFGGVALVLYGMFGWWSDVVAEGQGSDHTPVVRIGLRYGMILFIMSEVMFFSAWFWSFFKHAMYPMSPASPAVDGIWPPAGIVPFDPWHLPLINTLILLLSGVTLTWAHHTLVHGGSRREVSQALILTVLLGLSFTGLQAFEYSHAAFGLSGNIYGAVFFMATGFHGAHVIIGTIFLFVCLLRVRAGHFTAERHVGFEAAAWYWHFVDVVWLFLFSAVYIWGR
ncbi:cytochrome c oxidase subunit 3 [Phaeovulum sp.]|uniref:cytochrome c oxidase subunit 3 n=1 Tax=Phaeovulum sp. TaxID=2934796 RepID=UPI00272FB18B|nr:cytochrome c oxidase subunit 3 [Phaeovulum sp.]MDP1670438.1 cytochrome c oxidase subunit 3 [Phaeovulum sp.]MDZ4120763.1 cytochrome c oxidase subunit 3 [Phaeovulum sp.]